MLAIYKYEPYGEQFSAEPAFQQPWRYAGGYRHASGLIKFGYRYYRPSQMRWTQRDAIEQPLQEAGWNDYIYAGDSPVSLVDRSGAFSFNPIDWLKRVDRYIEKRRWVRCVLLAAGALGLAGEAVLVIRTARTAIRLRKPILLAIHRSRSGKLGTTGSLLVLASVTTGGCIGP